MKYLRKTYASKSDRFFNQLLIDEMKERTVVEIFLIMILLNYFSIRKDNTATISENKNYENKALNVK